MFDDYAYYSKKEIVSDVEQPVYGTNDRGKEEKQYAMGVLSLKSDQNNDSGSGGTSSGGSNNPGTGSGSNTSSSSSGSNVFGLGVTPKDIFDASSARKADMLKAIGEFYTGSWYDDTDGTHKFNSYGFTPLMMATQAQCYESIDYILGKIDNNNHTDQENIKRLYDAVYQKHEKITDDDSSRRSAVKIAQDNKDEEAENRLTRWLEDWVYTIKYTNSNHTDLKIQLPASETVFKGDSILLPSITGKYISTNENEPIRWEPKRWYISESGKDYSFNTYYTLDDNVTATLVCVKAHVTLTYSFGDVQTGIELPNSVTIQSGSKITLGGATGEYTDKDNIRWEATGWTIDESGEFYNFDTEYTIYDDTVAVLNLEKVKVTLTYKDENNLGIPDFPESCTVPCGDPITLPTLGENGKYTASDQIVWNLLGWTIDKTDFEFGNTYGIYENTDAYLKCEKAKVKLTYINENPVEIPVPAEETYTSGDFAELKSVDGEFKDKSKYKTYKPIEWVIDGSGYDFSENYQIYDDTEAKLKCDVSDIPVGIVIEPTSLTLEEGTSEVVKFKLESEPNEDVILTLNKRFDGLIIDTSKLTLNSSNWSDGQSVKFTALDDNIDNANKSTTVVISVASEDTYYDNISDETLSVTIVNNDIAGIEPRLNSTTITEGNSTMCFFKLKSKPTSPIKLNIAITSGSDRLSVSKSELIFTESNWKDEQSIEIEATNNTTADGDTTATIKVTVDPSSLDSKYKALGSISFNITIKDNDTAGVNYDTSTLTITEGASLLRGFSLKSKPTDDVELNFTSTYGRITAPSLTFTPDDWSATKYPKFTAGNVVGTDKVTISASSTDSNYNRTMGSFNVNITAAPDIDYSDLPMDLTEGSYVRRQFKLTAQPKDSVTLTISSSSNITSRLYIGTSSTSTTISTTLTFTTSNYGTAQYVYFRAKDDEIVNGDVSGTIQIVATSSDDQYKNLLKAVNVTVKDNDSEVAEGIGKLAFTSNTFPIIVVSSSDKFLTIEDTVANVHDTWSNQYSAGYVLPYLPKSPNWTSTNKVFNYDPLYLDGLED